MIELAHLWPDPDRRDDALARLHERINEAPREITEKEARYLGAVSFGLDETQAGEVLGVGRQAVVDGLARARRVLRAKNTTHAVALALRQGLIR